MVNPYFVFSLTHLLLKNLLKFVWVKVKDLCHTLLPKCKLGQ